MSALLEDHIVLFLDFLGFSNASVQADLTTQDTLLQLLHTIGGMRANFAREVTPNESGHTISYQPAISTFSDHIVFSFPVSQLSFGGLGGEMLTALFQIDSFVAWVVRSALANGFLTRGGVALGKLYHSDGVVFGPAMIEAHDLESKTSVYPRVVVSPTALARPDVLKDNMLLRRDRDGLVSINCFRTMILRAAIPGVKYRANVNAWLEGAIQIVKDKIELLSGPRDLNARSKWVWFANQLHETLSQDAHMFDHFIETKTRDALKDYIASL